MAGCHPHVQSADQPVHQAEVRMRLTEPLCVNKPRQHSPPLLWVHRYTLLLLLQVQVVQQEQQEPGVQLLSKRRRVRLLQLLAMRQHLYLCRTHQSCPSCT